MSSENENAALTPVQQVRALREYPLAYDVVDDVVIGCTDDGREFVIALGVSAISRAELLRDERGVVGHDLATRDLRTDRWAQLERSVTSLSVRGDGRSAAIDAVRGFDADVIVAPRSFDRGSAWVVPQGDLSALDKALDIVGEEVVVRPSSDSFLVETVTANGRHLVVDAAAANWSTSAGQRFLRSRSSLDPQVDAAVRSAALDAVARCGIEVNGALVELSGSIDDPVVVDVVAALDERYLTPEDASFAAFGTSVAHVVAEGLARPAEFWRRYEQPMVRPRKVATRFLAEPGPTARPGMVEVRRLPWFHSATDRGSDLAVSFVGTDRPGVDRSVGFLGDMEGAGRLGAKFLISIAFDPWGDRVARAQTQES